MTYIRGENWMICDVCGFKYRQSQIKTRWDGAKVCEADFELRHPQDFLRGIPDHPAAPYTNPEQPDQFVPQTLQVANTGVPVVTQSTGLPVEFQEPESSEDIGIIQYNETVETPSDIVQPRTQLGCPTGTTG
jgi:hypothetical protein